MDEKFKVLCIKSEYPHWDNYDLGPVRGRVYHVEIDRRDGYLFFVLSLHKVVSYYREEQFKELFFPLNSALGRYLYD